MRRSTVQSLPLQLVFPANGITKWYSQPITNRDKVMIENGKLV